MNKKYTARVKVAFSVYYHLAIPTDNPDPSDEEVLDKICGKQIFTMIGETKCAPWFGLDTRVLGQEGVQVEHVDWDGDPNATGKHGRRDWEITIDESGKGDNIDPEIARVRGDQNA